MGGLELARARASARRTRRRRSRAGPRRSRGRRGGGSARAARRCAAAASGARLMRSQDSTRPARCHATAPARSSRRARAAAAIRAWARLCRCQADGASTTGHEAGRARCASAGDGGLLPHRLRGALPHLDGERVQPDGRSRSVAGISFMVSTKTRISAVRRPPRIRGRWTRRSAPPVPAPRARAASSRLAGDRAEARVHGLHADARGSARRRRRRGRARSR